jgi:hypothetical protein
LFVLRLDEDYSPVVALEVPRSVVKEHFEEGRMTWTRGLKHDERSIHIDGGTLLKKQAARRR